MPDITVVNLSKFQMLFGFALQTIQHYTSISVQRQASFLTIKMIIFSVQTLVTNC
jgi:hypothetical protein